MEVCSPNTTQSTSLLLFPLCLLVYGIDLVTILKLQQMKIPNVIRECVCQVESRGMDSLGIYRMSGKQEEISTIKDSYNSGTNNMYKFFSIHIYMVYSICRS